MECEFKGKYWDWESRELVEFKCSEPTVKDGLCIFHRPEYWKENEENEKQVRERFYEKVEDSRRDRKKLLCIGYNLPSVEVGGDFQSPVYFNHAKFFGKARFFKARFFREVGFPHAEFFKEACFSDTEFYGIADFFRVNFFGETKFRSAKFSERAFFTGLRKDPEGYYDPKDYRKDDSENDPVLFFEGVTFEKPELVMFNGFNLANTSFLYTDVSKIDIGDRVWWGFDRRIFDERKEDERRRKGKHSKYEPVATVYRRLRQNLESKMRYTEAGRFFIGEMECKRKNVKTKNPVLRWIRINILSALTWYKYMSNYGESHTRVIPWMVLTLLLASLLTTLTRIPHLNISSTDFLKHFHDYLFALFQLKTDNIEQFAVRIMGLLLMGQLFIALRRQFERRYRG